MKDRKRENNTICELTASVTSHAPPVALRLCPTRSHMFRAVPLGTREVLVILRVFQRRKAMRSGCFTRTVCAIDLGTEHRSQVSNMTRERRKTHLDTVHEPPQSTPPAADVGTRCPQTCERAGVQASRRVANDVWGPGE